MSRTSYRRPNDEGGSVLPLVALTLVTLLVSTALAVDLGMVVATNRRLQAVADLAALAGSNEIVGAACDYSYTEGTVSGTVFEHVRQAAVTSAATNGFPLGGTKNLVVEVGTITYAGSAPTFSSIHSTASGGDCTSDAVPTAVKVTSSDYTDYAFASVIGREGKTTQRLAVAGRKINPTTTGSTTTTSTPGSTTTTPGGTSTTIAPCSGPCGPAGTPLTGGFTIGSSVANLDTTNSPVLNEVLDGMVCRGFAGTCSFSTTLVGYQGLATAGVTLGQLQSQLGAGSVTSLLDSSIRARDLYLATAKALGCSAAAGCSNAAAVTLLGLSTSVTSTTTFKLGQLITLASGSEEAAAASTFNVLGLVTGSAQVINGTNTIDVPVTTVTIPGATSTSLKVKVIELPRTYIGPVGGSVTTSQVEVTVEQVLNVLNVPIAGIPLVSVASVTGTLPITVTAGSATGTLLRVECVPANGEVVSVDTHGATTAIGGSGNFLAVKVAGIQVAGLNVNATSSVAGVNGNLLAFDYPADYLPTLASPTHVGGTTLNVQGTSVSSSLSVGGLSLNASVLTAALTGPTGAVTVLDKNVISPVLRALGVDVGGADVWAVGSPGCPSGGPVIVG